MPMSRTFRLPERTEVEVKEHCICVRVIAEMRWDVMAADEIRVTPQEIALEAVSTRDFVIALEAAGDAELGCV